MGDKIQLGWLAKGAFVAAATVGIGALSSVLARRLLQGFMPAGRAGVIAEILGIAMFIGSCALYFSGRRAW
ncbi:hypothetical protein [Paraburkholderia sp. UCT2]|uniref:hypothetical protein n=1 Tax=Paraburkholderia sp. UCT2 TaxID=2615208 RepID=UPI001654F489|nr:hypothetical protein [Paraburkholderia sp. UCT2]MBC8727757.1 hypothetical protein [Paraburkholderia sp. UCT2]